MRHSDCSRSIKKVYEYKPTHIILDEMCMLIQTRYFSIADPKKVIEIDHKKYNKNNHSHVIVREISFGKMYNPGLVHPLALWFHIDDDDVRECTIKEIQRHKRTKTKLNNKKKEASNADHIITPSTHSSSNSHNGDAPSYAQIVQAKNVDIILVSTPDSTSSSINKHIIPKRTSFFDNDQQHQCSTVEPPFIIHYPKDEASNELISSILTHRLHTLNDSGGNSCSSSSSIINSCRVLSENELQHRFESLKIHYSMFNWPVNEGREIVDETTLVPEVDTEYEVPTLPLLKETTGNDSYHTKIWKLFIEASSHEFYHHQEEKNGEKKEDDEKRQLGVFKLLSKGGLDSYDGSGNR
jgi:hypothetical protein